jgi:DNA repair protein RecO (recombination protein O)
MTGRERFAAEAFILRLYDYGEADRIVTLFGRDQGKIKGIAKGAKNSRRRFVNVLEPFTLGRFQVSRKNPAALCLIEEGTALSHYPRIRANLTASLVASYFLDLVDLLTVEGKSHPGIFTLLQDYLTFLDNQERMARKLIPFFELALLKASGYEPALEACLLCRTPLQAERQYHFFPAQGGIRCGNCLGETQRGPQLACGTLKTLLFGKNLPVAELGRVGISEAALRECRLIFPRMIEHILGRVPKSQRILYRLLPPQGP